MDSHRDSADLLSAWGLSTSRAGDPARAREFFVAASVLMPSEPRFILSAGECCVRLGDLDRAVELYSALLALELTPQQIETAQAKLDDVALLPAAQSHTGHITKIADALSEPDEVQVQEAGMRVAAADVPDAQPIAAEALEAHATEMDEIGDYEQALKARLTAHRCPPPAALALSLSRLTSVPRSGSTPPTLATCVRRREIASSCSRTRRRCSCSKGCRFCI